MARPMRTVFAILFLVAACLLLFGTTRMMLGNSKASLDIETHPWLLLPHVTMISLMLLTSYALIRRLKWALLLYCIWALLFLIYLVYLVSTTTGENLFAARVLLFSVVLIVLSSVGLTIRIVVKRELARDRKR